MGVLTVVLDRIENLRDKDGIGKSDPYVKFELEKNKLVFDRSYGKKESSKKKNDLNPVYNETFVWEDVPELSNMKLKVKVKDEDIGIDKTIGEAEIELELQHLSASPKPVTVVIDPKKFKIFSSEATIHLIISFQE